MGRLIKAEFRKILTTKLWWALMIPTVLLALGWALGSGWLATQFVDALGGPEFRELQQIVGVDSSEWILSVFAMARSINIATIFPLIFGGLAISSEISNKTITTTFLTAQNRTAALTAKMITYIAWGAIYGLAIVISVSIGVFLTTDADRLPGAGAWLAMAAVGVLASILMTMFGIGIGALVRSVPGTVVLLVLYFLILENGAHLLLSGQQPDLIGFLPNGSINGLTGSVAADIFLSAASAVPDEVDFIARSMAGALGAQAWHLSGLIFLGWAALAFGGGWLVTQKRDIT
jgi:ABC-2 type transport system permease protein